MFSMHRNFLFLSLAVLAAGCGEVTAMMAVDGAGEAGLTGAGGELAGASGEAGSAAGGASGAGGGSVAGAPGGSGGGTVGRGGAGGSTCVGAWKMLCNGVCTNTSIDVQNCGNCGLPCAGGSSCVNGACMSTGTAGTVGTGGRGGVGGGPAWYCPGGTDVTCATQQGVGTCTAKCTLGQSQRGTQPDGATCFCFFHAPGTGDYTDCPPDSYCYP